MVQLILLYVLAMLRTTVRKQAVPQIQDHTCQRRSTQPISMADNNNNNSLDQHRLTVTM
jgi:hypothetical protein